MRRLMLDSGVETVILRPGTFFGPGDRLHFGRMAQRLKNGKGVIIGSGNNALPFCYVTDVVQGFMLATYHEHAPGNVYNITNDHPLTQLELFNAVADAVDGKRPTLRLPYLPLYYGGMVAEQIAHLTHTKPLVTPLGVMMFGSDNRHSIDKARQRIGLCATGRSTRGHQAGSGMVQRGRYGSAARSACHPGCSTRASRRSTKVMRSLLSARKTKVTIGLLVGIGLLFLVSRFVNLSTSIQAMQEHLATPRGILLALLSGVAFLLAFSVRGVRWKLFLNPVVGDKVSTFKAIQLFLVSIFINFLLPIQGGEVAKCVMIKRITGVPISRTLPTVAMDRSLDLMPALFIIIILPLLGVQMDIKLWFVLALVVILLRQPDRSRRARRLETRSRHLPDSEDHQQAAQSHRGQDGRLRHRLR